MSRSTSNLALLGLAVVSAAALSPPWPPAGAQTLHTLETTTPLGASATFTGVTRDAGDSSQTPWNQFSCYIITDQVGTARLEKSSNGSAWTVGLTQPIVAATPLRLTDRADSRYSRCVVVNGATAETALTVRSSYGR